MSSNNFLANGIVVLVVPYSLKFPEAIKFIDHFQSNLEPLLAARCYIRAIVLDMTNVEYLDYSGVQALLATKEYLATLMQGREIPIHFANMRTSHLNRLVRIVGYNSNAGEQNETMPDAAAVPSLSAPSSPGTTYLEDPVYVRRPQAEKTRTLSNASQSDTNSRNRRPSLKNLFLGVAGRSASGSRSLKPVKSKDSINGGGSPERSPDFNELEASPLKRKNTGETKSVVTDGYVALAGNVRALKHFHVSVDDALLSIQTV
ncbi:hypothetical protein HDU84_002909 [Entophlyctis sp. JEL0112]|nr:hypothetical protein HDU84_002909 [Entophlyctis sp. JEL0112]